MKCQRVNQNDVRCTKEATHVEVIEDALGTMVVNLCDEHKTVKGMSLVEIVALIAAATVIAGIIGVLLFGFFVGAG